MFRTSCATGLIYASSGRLAPNPNEPGCSRDLGGTLSCIMRQVRSPNHGAPGAMEATVAARGCRSSDSVSPDRRGQGKSRDGCTSTCRGVVVVIDNSGFLRCQSRVGCRSVMALPRVNGVGRMDPITLIVSALAAGAALGAQDTVSTMVKDAYAGLKVLAKRQLSGGRAQSWCSPGTSRVDWTGEGSFGRAELSCPA